MALASLAVEVDPEYTLWFCHNCMVTYDEPVPCAICDGAETVPVPKYVINQWDSCRKSLDWHARRYNADLVNVRFAASDDWHVRLGRYMLGYHRTLPGPWQFTQYPRGRFARATFGGSLRQLFERVVWER